MWPFRRGTLYPPSPLFRAPARQYQGFFIVFLLVEDGRGIEVRVSLSQIRRDHGTGSVSYPKLDSWPDDTL